MLEITKTCVETGDYYSSSNARTITHRFVSTHLDPNSVVVVHEDGTIQADIFKWLFDKAEYTILTGPALLVQNKFGITIGTRDNVTAARPTVNPDDVPCVMYFHIDVLTIRLYLGDDAKTPLLVLAYKRDGNHFLFKEFTINGVSVDGDDVKIHPSVLGGCDDCTEIIPYIKKYNSYVEALPKL